MRKSAIGFLAWFAFAATACVRTATNEATGAVDVDIESPGQRGEDWKGTFAGQGMWSAMTGTTHAAVLDGRTTLTITLAGAAPGSTFTWAVREGKCNENGMVVGHASAYSTLTVDSYGKAGATADVAMRLDEAKDYVVEIFGPTTDPATGKRTVAACGDLDD
jgi:hypothetical protein